MQLLAHLDHVAYVSRELEAGVDAFKRAYDVSTVREVEVAQFSARAAMLSAADGSVMIEVIEFADDALAASHLGVETLRLDHFGYRVADIQEAGERLRAVGARFCTPDGDELHEPFELGGNLHLWTVEGTVPGSPLQLTEIRNNPGAQR